MAAATPVEFDFATHEPYLSGTTAMLKTKTGGAGTITRTTSDGLRREFSSQSLGAMSAGQEVWWKRQGDFWIYCKLYNIDPSTKLSMSTNLGV